MKRYARKYCSNTECPTPSNCAMNGCHSPFSVIGTPAPQPAPPTDNGTYNCICFADKDEGHLPSCVVANMRAPDANACTCPKNGHGHASWCRFSGQTAAASRPQPAEPTGATDTTRLDWIEAEAKRLLKRDPLQLRTRIILTAEEVLNAGDVRRAIDARVASHPAEPETPSHPCPRCGAACICAEGFDGDPCQHFRIGCKSAAPAEPERGTTRNG